MIPLVFVHGFMGGSEQWYLQRELGNNRDLICLDFPGFGKNAHLPAIDKIEDFADWALQELTRQGIKNFHLLGHSMGGMIVQSMVNKSPERVKNLILYATGFTGLFPGRFETMETSMKRAVKDGAIDTARRISATWFLEYDKAEHYQPCANIATMCSLSAILAGLKAMSIWSGEGSLAHINAPTLVIAGSKDRTYPWAQISGLWQNIPNCDLAFLPDCAHAIHMEKPHLFNSIIDDFLKTASSP